MPTRDERRLRTPSRSRDARSADPRFSKDPWADAPVEELQDQVLPRWFVLLAIAAVVVGAVVLVMALLATAPREVPLGERRPPPGNSGLTHDVGALEVGTSEPVVYERACSLLEGVRVAGTAADQANLRRSLAAACNAAGGDVAEGLRAFADAGGVVRYATFSETGVDSTATTSENPPVIYLNSRFSSASGLLGAPLIAHDVVAVTDPGDARTELDARIAEADVCASLFAELPRSCETATALVTTPGALRLLRAAGYR